MSSPAGSRQSAADVESRIFIYLHSIPMAFIFENKSIVFNRVTLGEALMGPTRSMLSCKEKFLTGRSQSEHPD